VWAHRIQFASKRDELMDNFKWYTRGAIRKPPNVLTWVSGILKLKASGDLDVASIVRNHNANSSKNGQLLGPKAQVVKNIVELMPSAALTLLEDHVRNLGWENSAFTDDCLSTKKYLPGHQFRRAGGLWISRGKVTKESCELMIKHICMVHVMTPSVLRRKVDRANVEEQAEEAALVWHMGQALKQCIPVSEEVLRKDWLDKYVSGNTQVMLEIQMAIQDSGNMGTGTPGVGGPWQAGEGASL
jgi:hypothetical protein